MDRKDTVAFQPVLHVYETLDDWMELIRVHKVEMDRISGATSQRMALAMMRIAKYVYWIVGLVIVVGGCYFLYNTLERPVAAVLVFLGGMLALYFYYVKWFVALVRNPAWPPYQTPCPDYLTLVSPGFTGSGNNIKPKAGEPYVCMDFVGVSTNGKLKKTSFEDVADEKMKANYTEDDIKKLLIEQKRNDPVYSFVVDPKDTQESLRAKTTAAGLSWISLLGN